MNFLLLIIVISIFVIFSEVILRFIYPLEYSVQREHVLSDYGVFSREENLKFTYPREEFIQEIKINSKGLRDYEYSYDKGDAYRIILVGDSFTDAYQVKLEETTPKILEKKLKKLGNYEVINFGFNGYGLIPEAILIEEEVIKYSPDMIILNFFVGNDFKDIDVGSYNKIIPDEFWLNENHDMLKESVYEKDFNLRLRSFLTRNSMLYFLIKESMRNFEDDNIRVNNINPIYQKVYDDELQENLETTNLIFQFLNDLTSKNEIKFLVFLIPAKEQVDINIFNELLEKNDKSIDEYDLEKPQILLRDLLESSNIEYFDLLPSLRKENINNTFYWEFDGHFNPKGYNLAADLVYKELINRKYLK